MKKTFCDRCGVEHRQDKPVNAYDVKSSIDLSNGETNSEYAFEGAEVELCQTCAAYVAALCKTFIVKLLKLPKDLLGKKE